MRAAWRTAWQRHLQRLPLEPLQAQMVDLITLHPEYHAQLSTANSAVGGAADGSDEDANSFLHLALHMALREQLATNRPRGIAQIHQQLCATAGNGHAAEHRMIEVLGRTLWDAQQAGRMPDEQQYLAALQKL